jgi:hypothetical protein
MGFLSRKSKDWDVDEVLALQLSMTSDTWEALQRHGVTAQTELRLDFFYEAPGATEAADLASFLHAETDYDVESDAQSVTGTTQPTTVSAEILDQWVRWMVLAGAEHGRCAFDGWGAQVP